MGEARADLDEGCLACGLLVEGVSRQKCSPHGSWLPGKEASSSSARALVKQPKTPGCNWCGQFSLSLLLWELNPASSHGREEAPRGPHVSAVTSEKMFQLVLGQPAREPGYSATSHWKSGLCERAAFSGGQKPPQPVWGLVWGCTQKLQVPARPSKGTCCSSGEMLSFIISLVSWGHIWKRAKLMDAGMWA